MKQVSPFLVFDRFPDIFTAISLREDGGMKIRDVNAPTNRERFINKIGVKPENLISADLVHGNNVEIVTQKNAGLVPKTDGLITNQKGLYLAITVADCLPIVIYHPKKELIALLHAGWRGLDLKIIEEGIKKLKDEFDVDLGELIVSVGPGIGVCHYKVGEDVLGKFSEYGEAINNRDGKYFLNLKLVALQQLMDVGLKRENIEVSNICTYCEADVYFSSRKDKTVPVQTMIVVAGMK